MTASSASLTVRAVIGSAFSSDRENVALGRFTGPCHFYFDPINHSNRCTDHSFFVIRLSCNGSRRASMSPPQLPSNSQLTQLLVLTAMNSESICFRVHTKCLFAPVSFASSLSISRMLLRHNSLLWPSLPNSSLSPIIVSSLCF